MSRWKRWVETGARKLRGILGLSFIGGILAAIGGSLFTAAAILIDYGMPFSRELPALVTSMLGELAGVFFVLGAITTGTFATLLSVTGRTLTLRELSVPKAALTGAVIGMLIPVTIIGVVIGGPFALQTIVEGLPVWIGIGAAAGGISGGLVATAKRAEAREISAGDEPIARIEA